MLSKAELARKAGLSTLTIDRVEAGRPCRLDTKRKILLALGLRVTDKDRVFGDEQQDGTIRREASPAHEPAAHAAPRDASQVTRSATNVAQPEQGHAASGDAMSRDSKREPSQ
jgi:hypothetical protein